VSEERGLRGEGLNLCQALGGIVGPNYTCLIGDCSPESDELDAGFFNTDLVLRDGCAGFFIRIHNWIICDVLWLILIALSLLAWYRYKDSGRYLSAVALLAPILVGFFTYVWIGILVALLEHIVKSVKREEVEERMLKEKSKERASPPAGTAPVPPGFRSSPSSREAVGRTRVEGGKEEGEGEIRL